MDEIVKSKVKKVAEVQTLLEGFRLLNLDGGSGFIVSTLRYSLTLVNGEINQCIFQSHKEKSEGYDDDDYLGGPDRLGETETQGGARNKSLFERLLKTWFERYMLGLDADAPSAAARFGRTFDINVHKRGKFGELNDVLEKLLPSGILQSKSALAMKVDLYTNRTLVGWHKDWNDGHALVIGLLNVSPGAVGSTELVFDPDTMTDEQTLIGQNKLRPVSVTRGLLQKEAVSTYAGQSPYFLAKEAQAPGELRWFNDVVWIHRTPPDGPGKFNEAKNDKYFMAGWGSALAAFVGQGLNAGNRHRYSSAPIGDRMLLRVTIRDKYEPRPTS